MSGIQSTEFQEHFDIAKFTDVEAATAITNPGEIVSFFGRRGIPDLFVLAFATRQGRVGPLCLNRTTAEALRRVLTEQGF